MQFVFAFYGAMQALRGGRVSGVKRGFDVWCWRNRGERYQAYRQDLCFLLAPLEAYACVYFELFEMFEQVLFVCPSRTSLPVLDDIEVM